MSWFNLNYIFGESSGTNTSTFIPGSSVVWLVCLAVITVTGVQIMKTIFVPRTMEKTMTMTF
ncbi:hypothetical protein Hanom_Chr06g00567151 [Helianthus anomalus]